MDALLCSSRLKYVVETSMPLSLTNRLIFSACVSHFARSVSSLIVLRRMFNWVTTRLVNWLDEPLALCVPVGDAGDPALLDRESEGECRARRDEPPPALPMPADDKLARDAARRGLPAAVALRERLLVCRGPTEPDGETNELADDVEDCRLAIWRLAATEV